MPNEPTDVWAPARIISPDLVPKHFGKFRDMMMLKIAQFKYLPKSDSTQRAYEVMQPAVRFTLDDILELPDAVDQMVEIEMGPQQKKIYKALATTCYAALQGNQITAVNAGALLTKLLQVSTGWVYDKDHKIVPLDADDRVRALIDAVNATDRKIIIFTPFKHTLAGISDALTKDGIDHAVVSGDTSATERGEIFNAFQNSSKYKAIAAHPQTMAHGLTLTAADTMAWFAPITSYEIFEQARARIRRVGQRHKQLYLHFTGSPVEKKLYAMLHKRQSVQDSFLELFEEATRLT
jgi:SNF2 family DNA or RNA helicase